jgi:hypothetical protein
MTLLRVIQCDGTCGARLEFEGRPPQDVMISKARKQRWTVTVDGRHYCRSCQENRIRYRGRPWGRT